MSTDARSHVVIVGGEFGGIAAARALRDAPVRVSVLEHRGEPPARPDDGTAAQP